MTPIKIPLELLIPCMVSMAGLILLVLNRKHLHKRNKALCKSGLIFLFSYTLIVGNALGHDLYYQWDVNRYDLNQNGFFESPAETTPQQTRALERLTHDTRRNASYITGFIVSAVLSVSVYLVMRLSAALLEAEDHENKTNNLNNIPT